MIARITGPVLNVERRSGVSRPRDGQSTGNPYTITTVRVLVEDLDTTEVNIPETELPPHKGDFVDYIVQFSTYGGRLQCRFQQHAPHAELSVAK
jgi:hypothetical protein